MIPVPSGFRVWLAVGHTDTRRGMNSLALQVQEGLKRTIYDDQFPRSVERNMPHRLKAAGELVRTVPSAK
jgi:transposase